ncbi:MULTISPECIES: hypothetical protein [unclassified Rhodococcus (in: high G+C Gram-positive bacteria)]|uniref:hypothetical protein n=1 Tax=unclassified Rhodococcus (in: high G+C Gram-positive bacteria) TaxID=192944 RepID=UPI000A8D0078|nr:MULTISPECIES: hypothetical protein [unclassified Rhodococcus (in: high G+C Gram-positive bacteria)]
MSTSPFGPYGIPDGDPGFTVSVEIDTMLDDLTEDDCARLLASAGVPRARIDESALLQARVVFELPHTGWIVSAQEALDTAERVAREFVVVGAETCRSDLWAREPWFPTQPDNAEFRYEEPETPAFTVTVEIETTAPNTDRGLGETIFSCFDEYLSVRRTPSPAGRQHLVVDPRSAHLDGAAQRCLKALWCLSGSWSITRLRVVADDVYRLECSDRLPRVPETLPEWQYAATDDGNRVVAVPDLQTDLTGWSIEALSQDGHEHPAPFVLGRVWQDDDGIVNLRGVGRRCPAWTATIEHGHHLDCVITTRGTTFPVDAWDATANWLVESMIGNPVGLIVDLGPSNYDPDVDDEVINAQLHKLDDGVVMVRRSRTVLEQRRLLDHSVDGLTLDTWHHDDLFDDCTDGYLFTADLRLAAQACTAWFRDHGGVDSLDHLGCSYSMPDTLPHTR